MNHSPFGKIKKQLGRQPRIWLVTGCAGFIGSHLVELLLQLGQQVVGLDNFSTGKEKNLKLIEKAVGKKNWRRISLIKGDVSRLADCYRALGTRPPGSRGNPHARNKGPCRSKIDIILHQAGLGSVPRSIADPLSTHATNVTGTVNMLWAAKNAGVRRFVYAASSSTYGDSAGLPKLEDKIGRALSPYAVSKHADELYAGAFGRCYGLETFGLRYFNVFGPRQDPQGAYAAVIPRWIGEILKGQANVIYGDGRTSRDFCYVDNVVQANLLAATCENRRAFNEVYNVACGQATTLRELHAEIRRSFGRARPELKTSAPRHRPFRDGDVRHSLASVSKARRLLGFRPTDLIREGLQKTVNWFAACHP